MVEKNSPAVDPLQPFHLSCSSDRVTYASSLLAPKELKILKSVFQHNKDIFFWTHYDMPEIHPSIASHRINVIPFSRRFARRFDASTWTDKGSSSSMWTNC